MSLGIFELEFSNSEKIVIEIIAIADEVDLFRTFKYQERITNKSNYKNIQKTNRNAQTNSYKKHFKNRTIHIISCLVLYKKGSLYAKYFAKRNSNRI